MNRMDAISWVVSVCAASLGLSQVKTLATLVASAMRPIVARLLKKRSRKKKLLIALDCLGHQGLSVADYQEPLETLGMVFDQPEQGVQHLHDRPDRAPAN